VGYERLQEIADPALALERTRENWRKLGRSEKWITQRMTGPCANHRRAQQADRLLGCSRDKAGGGVRHPHQYHSRRMVRRLGPKAQDLKGLESQNLRDHMSEAELIFTALAELSTRQIAETAAVGLPANKRAAKTGGGIAHRARLELESKTGRKVVTGENYLPPSKTEKTLTP
jgi:hypothetical protein